MGLLLTPLTDIGPALAPYVGGKATGLLKSLTLGHSVPPGAVLESRLVPQDGAVTERWLRTATAEVLDWARRSNVRHLAIRSSATVEDGTKLSYAGIFRSAFTRPVDSDVMAALATVAESAVSPLRTAYEEAAAGGVAGSSPPAGTLAILVQATVRARSSGIAFGWTEVDGKHCSVIEGSWGLAMGLVSGISGGDLHRSGARPEVQVRAKPLAVYPTTSTRTRPGDFVLVDCADGVPLGVAGKVVFTDEPAGLVYVRLPTDAAERTCLNPKLLSLLDEALAAASRSLPGFANGVDMEWAEDDHGRLWVVQLRPMTTSPPGKTDGKSSTHRAPRGTIVGEPGAPGTHTGSVSHEGTIGAYVPDEGRVLVCGAARPELLPALVRASAVVSSDGGMLCHLAIIARELGKPCVIGVAKARELLVDDEVITVDGTVGVIRRESCGTTLAPPPQPQPSSVGFAPPDRLPDPGDPIFGEFSVVVLVLTGHGPSVDEVVPVPNLVLLTRHPSLLTHWSVQSAPSGWYLLTQPNLPERLSANVLEEIVVGADTW
ncbi:PEP/pyruvate-binding domain-containing protein [Streptomyces sp. NPDC096934]|uniref:PEP/pyruvate-binding domain-containing protein n=1 Tax=Streptomyces sp. NPDC096934 TaxID=3155551 RepID=UPI00332A6805